ncbi:transcription factor S [Nanoarchaeota archaeon]
MFCPKCGSILVPKKEGSKKLLVCGCGYKSNKTDGAVLKEAITKKEKKVEVIDRSELETLPKMKVTCDKCKNNEAYYWTVQTRAADEAATRFMKCTKCGHTWRDYN